MDSTGGEEGFTVEQRSGLEAHRVDQDRTLAAMHALEAALAEAAPRREATWRNQVFSALTVLQAAMEEEATNAERPDSLLSDLARTQPWLRTRARALRLQYRSLCTSIAALRSEIEAHSQASDDQASDDFADIRQRLGWLLNALRYQRGRESDLIYEAYYDAFKVELRQGPPSSTSD